MVALPSMTAAFLGGFSIYGDASGWLANGRVQNLAQLDVSVVRLAQDTGRRTRLVRWICGERGGRPEGQAAARAGDVGQRRAGGSCRSRRNYHRGRVPGC